MPLLLTRELTKSVGSDCKGEGEEHQISSGGKYEGDSKSKGKIHLTALTEVTVSNFTYHFST